MPTRATPLTLKDSSAYEIPATAEDPRGHRAAGPVNTSLDAEALINDLLADFRALTVCGSTLAENRSAIAIEAAVPGAGKTSLIKAWLERTGQKETGVTVCPWDALVTHQRLHLEYSRLRRLEVGE